MSVIEAFREATGAHQRCFWLDGGGAREWSGRQSLIGILEPDDISLTYSAATGEVTRHVDLPLEGVQFHPESILTEHGAALVANFLGLS